MFNDSEYVTYVLGFPVHVSKVGGGTLGKRYEGEWTVSVFDGDVILLDNEILRTGTARNHEEVAELAYDCAMHYAEEH